MLVSHYDYALPPSAIAQEAVEPRDASRLLDTVHMRDLRFSDLVELTHPGDLIVVNTTRVRAARLKGRRETGGASEILLTRRLDHERWEALVRPAKKLRAGSVIPCDGVVVRVLSESNDGVVSVAVEAEGDIESAISRAGTIPLPPYFHGTLNTDDRYQTVFADRIGSSAAPTAALHFTDDLVARLKARGVGFATVELEIGLDTFRPMTSKLVDDHQIHSERIIIGATSAEQINTTKATGGRVVAVGTTVVRTLEAASDSSGFVAEFDGNTDLFIAPGYVFRTVDALVTNFHAPRTTLLVLVSTMLGERWKDVYTHALEHRYRFLSFGDAMWLEVPA